MKLDCGKVQEITRMYAGCIDDIPDKQAKNEYISHLEACEKCRSDSEEILQNIAYLKSFGDDIPTKDGLTITQSVMNTVNLINGKQKGKFKFRYMGTAVAAVIVAVIMIGSQSSLFPKLENQAADIADSVITEENQSNGSNSHTVKNGVITALPKGSGLNQSAQAETQEAQEPGVALKLKKAPQQEPLQEYNAQSIAESEQKEQSYYMASYDTDDHDFDTSAFDSVENTAFENSPATQVAPEDAGQAAAAPESVQENDDLLYKYLTKENARVELCVVHPDGYHTIPFEYANKIGLDEFLKWVMNIQNEEVEYTPEYFKQHFSSYFE